MAETTTHIPEKGLWRLKGADIIKSIILAALTNVLLVLYPIINSGGWPTKDDWHHSLTSTVAIIIAYLVKNVATNNTGDILKKDKPVVTVDAEKLNNLESKAAGT